jgi:hypothetical protein
MRIRDSRRKANSAAELHGENRGVTDGMVPVRGYAKGGDTENVEFVGIAA